MKNLPETGRVNRHFGIKKQREMRNRLFLQSRCAFICPGQRQFAIKGYDSDATRLSVNDVPDFRGMVKRANGVPYKRSLGIEAKVVETRTNRQPSNSGCTRALSAMECEEQHQCGARKQDKPQSRSSNGVYIRRFGEISVISTITARGN
jgi:hypothetical protein